MKKFMKLGVIAVLIFGAIGWFLFRPELLFLNKKVSEEFPSSGKGQPLAKLLTGGFVSDAHESSGEASIYQTADGKKILRLENFKTSNGPDVHLYLVASPEAKSGDAVKNSKFIDLGELKGNEGNQNYDLPKDLDLNHYRSVNIWCKRFSVNFGYAGLK